MKRRNVLILVTPAYQPRLAGIARYARQHGWQLTILDRIARQPRGWNGDGVLVTLRDNPETVAFVKSLRRQKIPVVDLTFNHPEMRLPRVSGDHAAMGRLAREHFEERNFHNFAWFSTNWLNIHRLRYEGFSNPSNISNPKRWIFSEEAPSERLDDFAWFNRWLGKKLRDAPKPLALLAYDDADAARALGACLAAGLSVPDDVAILGIGGDRLICENQSVPISSIEHDQGRTGYEGAELLDSLMDGKNSPRNPILIPPRGITVRASTDFIAAANPILRRTLEHIRANLAKPIGLSQIAEEVGSSRATVARLFEHELGHTAGKEIMRQRIDMAKRLLKNDSLSISEIAYRTGFCNPAYFTNTFRRATGLTPKSWRKK
ncbi:MAG: substrate-binding domain-containing protein [Kiritimatiellae bacterium]|nr:substrate-binding domain-containing protein [Kiritimatiellia bacterium]